MGWAKLDDKRHTSTKLAAAGLAANGLDANGITWCAANETDGFVADLALSFIAPGLTPRKAKAVADKLVEVGRWVRDDEKGGWWIHNYLEFQPNSDENAARRESARKRKEEERQRALRGSNGRFTPSNDPRHTNVTARHPRDTPVTPQKVREESPVSRPVPSRPEVLTSSSDLRVVPNESPDDQPAEHPKFEHLWRRWQKVWVDKTGKMLPDETAKRIIRRLLVAASWQVIDERIGYLGDLDAIQMRTPAYLATVVNNWMTEHGAAS